MPFDPQPTLRGTLVHLRPLRASDHAALYQVARDPLLWTQHPDKARAEPEGFQRFFDETFGSGGAMLVLDATTQQVIGTSQFHGADEGKGEIEIGWTFLARSHWGGRYNRELKQLMLDHAFKFVNRVIFVVDKDNTRSQKAVEKIGGTRVGSKLDDAGRENAVFEITASSWRRSE